MGVTEKAGFVIDLDADEAHRELSMLRQEVDGVVGGLQKASGTGSTFTSTMTGLGDSLKKSEPVIGKVATGVSGLAGTMGGAAGQTNALTGAVGNLAGAFAGGGIFAVGISVAVIGLGALVEGFTKAKTEAAEAEEAARSLAEGLVESYASNATGLLAAAQARVDALDDTQGSSNPIPAMMERASLQRDLANQRMADLEREHQLKRGYILDLEAGRKFARAGAVKRAEEQLAILEAEHDASKRISIDAADELVMLERQNREMASILAKEKELLETRKKKSTVDGDAGKRKARLAAREADAKKAAMDALRWEADSQKALDDVYMRFQKKKEEAAAATEKRIHDMRLGFIDMDIDAENKRFDRRAKLQADAERKSIRSHEAMLKKKEKDAEEAAQKRLDEEQATAQLSADITMQFAQIGLSGSQQIMAALITGQQDGIEAILAAQLAATGQAIVGIGMKGLAEGAVLAFTPGGQAAAVPLLAAGAGAVALGLSMGGAGIAWGHGAAGGQLGKALPESSGSSSNGGSGVGRVSTSRSSDNAAQAPTINNYVFQGATFDTIQTTRRVQRMRARESDLLQAEA